MMADPKPNQPVVAPSFKASWQDRFFVPETALLLAGLLAMAVMPDELGFLARIVTAALGVPVALDVTAGDELGRSLLVDLDRLADGDVAGGVEAVALALDVARGPRAGAGGFRRALRRCAAWRGSTCGEGRHPQPATAGEV